MATKFNTRYAHTRFEGDGIDFVEPSLTEQQFGYETDINNIVKGLVPPSENGKQPLFNVKVDANQFDEALNVIANARSQFELLPSDIRTEFDNDPRKLINFIQNDKNYDRAVELGLIEKKKPVITPTVPPLKPLNPTVTTEVTESVVTEPVSQ